MTESKHVNRRAVLNSSLLLAAASLLFFCLEFILAIEARSASLFADSVAVLEAASVGALTSAGRNWSLPGRESFARFSGTIIVIPTCFLFWMIAANYYGAALPSAVPLAAIGAALLLTNIACLVVPYPGRLPPLADSPSDVRNHAIKNIVIVLTGNDVAGCARRPWNLVRECKCRRAYLGGCTGVAAGRRVIR